MKAPICGVCLNSDMLCMACKKKLDEGKITECDIKVSRLISKAAKTFRQLNEVTINKVIEGKNVVVVMCNKGDSSKLIGKEGVITKKLSRAAGKTVRIVEVSDDIKSFIQNLVHPVPVVGLNVLYHADREILKVIIPRDRGIPIPQASFAEIVRIVFGKDSVIVNE